MPILVECMKNKKHLNLAKRTLKKKIQNHKDLKLFLFNLILKTECSCGGETFNHCNNVRYTCFTKV